MRRRRRTFVRACGPSLALAAAVMLVADRPVRAAGTGGLEQAITLYEAAQYGEALQILEALDTAGDEAADTGNAQAQAAPDVVAEYRILCLLALDRSPDARAVIKRLLERQPAYRPRSGDLPPRFLAVVREARTELLPTLVHAEYRAGKAGYDRKAYAEAETHFRKVVALLSESEVDPAVKAPLADVADLAHGFLALIEKSRAENAPPLPALAEGLSPAAIRGNIVYESGDSRVAPPVVVRQQFPEWPTLGGGNELLRRTRAKGVRITLLGSLYEFSAVRFLGTSGLMDKRAVYTLTL
jgi:tetratricopeptide (TPR) repeat protein